MESRTYRTIGALTVLAVLVVVGVAQAGTGQDDGGVEIAAPDSTAPDSTTSTATDPEATSTTVPPDPFTYRIGILAGVSTDNFWAFYGEQPSVWNSYVLGPTRPALFTASTNLGSLRPELAVGHDDPVEGEAGWMVEVDLDPGLKWSDGTPITSADVVFTFETVRNLDLGGSWAEAFAETVEAIEADGAHRLRIHFTEQPRLAVWPHGVGTAPIMAAHVWEDAIDGISAQDLYDLSGDGDVGGGPLAISSIGEDLIVSTRNDGYPNADTPDVVRYQVFPDEAAALAALADDEIDYLLSPKGLTERQIEDLEGAPGVELIHSPGNNIRYLGFNLTRAPMSDPAFRTALALLLDREQLAEAITHAGAAALGMIPAANIQWFNTEAATANAERYGGELEERLTRAIEVLEGAGYTWETVPGIDEDGEPVPGEGLTADGAPTPTLTILTPGDASDPARAEYAGAIADTLGLLGFETRPVETDFDTVVDLAFSPDEEGDLHYDMYLLGWTLGNPALPGYYGVLFSTVGPMNNTGYASEAFDAAHAAYVQASDLETAREALWEMEAILSADLPYLPLYSSEIVEVYRADRVRFDVEPGLGGLQASLGGIRGVESAN